MLNKKSRVRAFADTAAAERVGNWFKAITGNEASKQWCIDNKIGLTRAQSESGNSTGGFLAPVDFDSSIISIREQVGAFRAGCEVRPARSDGQLRPRRVGGLTANFVTEGSAIPESSFLLDSVESSQKKFAILARASSELFEDSTAADLGEFLTSEIAYAFASKEDDCGFNGDGTSTYVGMSGLGTKLVGLKSAVSAASSHNTFLTLDSTDLGNLMGAVLGSAIPGSAWYISALGFGQCFCRLASVGGGLTATMRPDGTISANYLGFPVRFSAKLPNTTSSLAGKPMLFFGNLAMSSLLVERQAQMVIAISRERALDADQILVRATERIDIINHSVGDATNPGAVAMLVGTT
jgi:HK97 family phage major capsid protein